MILCVNLNATEDLVYDCASLKMGGVSRASLIRRSPGGKGANVARALAALSGGGTKPVLVGFAPQMAEVWNKAYFESQGVSCRFIAVPGRARPCLILFDRSKNQETVLNSPSQMQAGAGHWTRLKKVLAGLAKPGGLVCISGSLPEGSPASAFAGLIRFLRGRGLRVFFDSSGLPFRRALAAKPFLVKPNLQELEEYAGRPLATEGARKSALRALVSQGPEIAVLSLGAGGCLALGGGRFHRVKALKPAPGPHSPVGCGDSFLAGLAWGLEQGLDFPDCLKWATAAGWANLGHLGAAQFKRQEVLSVLSKIQLGIGP
jgi:1-phosphofructokinase family hexose kinase